MAKQNLKIKPAKSKSKRPVVRGVKSKQKLKSAKPAPQSEWHIEIAQLQSKVFTSIDQAVATLAKGVVEKLGITGRSAAKEREFVQILLETDPALMKALEKSVRIK